MRRHRYTAEQEAWLRREAAHFPRSGLAKRFNRTFHTALTPGAVGRKCHALGIPLLNSGPAFTGRFRPGRAFVNLGPRRRNSGNFERGQVPVTAKPPGATRIDPKTGEVLVRTPNAARYFRPNGTIRASNYWKPRRVVVWEQSHGPVPEGHAVIRISNDLTDDSLENLACIPRSALARLNQSSPLRKLPHDPELRRLAVELAVLNQLTFDRGRALKPA